MKQVESEVRVSSHIKAYVFTDGNIFYRNANYTCGLFDYPGRVVYGSLGDYDDAIEEWEDECKNEELGRSIRNISEWIRRK